jgi:hypothetical protein
MRRSQVRILSGVLKLKLYEQKIVFHRSVYQSNYEIDIALARVDETYAPVLPSGIKQNNAYASKRKSVQRNESLLKNSQR